jgi:hypothetical protein
MLEKLLVLLVVLVTAATTSGCDRCGRTIFRELAPPFDGCAVDADCADGEVCDTECQLCEEPTEQ